MTRCLRRWSGISAILRDLGLTLALTLETHIHADHITGAGRLRALTGSKAGFPAPSAAEFVDFTISEGEAVRIGGIELRPLYTPGHTDDHHAYLIENAGETRIFTGDALLIEGCGRTDFQNGDATVLYRSVHDKIFGLPDETLVYPAHDYNQRQVSSVGQEKAATPVSAAGRRSRSSSPSCRASICRARKKWMSPCLPIVSAAAVRSRRLA